MYRATATSKEISVSYEFMHDLVFGIIGISIAGTILYLIRRDHLHSHHATWWLAVAMGIVVLGLYPKLIDYLAGILGIHYPPNLLFLFGIIMILVKVLAIDIHQSQLERKIRRLTQRLAILEEEQQDKNHSVVEE